MLESEKPVVERVGKLNSGKGSYWSLTIVSSTHGLNHLYQLIPLTLLPLISIDLSLTHYSAGLLVACFYIPYALLQVPFGYLSDLLGRRSLLAIGVLLFSFGILLTGLASEFWQIAVAQFLAGVGGSTYHAVGIPLVSELFRRGKLGEVMGFHQAGGAVGAFVAPLAAGFIAVAYSWKTSFIVLSILGIVLTPLIWFVVREPARSGPAIKDVGAGVVRYRAVVLLIVFGALYVLAYRGLSTFATLFIVESYGAGIAYAAFLLAMLHVAGIFGAPLSGRLSDAIGRRNVIAVLVLLQGVLVCLLTSASLGALAVALVAFGFVSFGAIAATDALFAEVAEGKILGTLFGFYITAGYVMSTVVPPFLGYLIDHAGFSFAFVTLGAATIMSIPLLYLARVR